LDLAEGLRLKPPQPQPRSCEPLGVAWPAAARSAAPVLPLSWPEPLLRSHLDWRHRPRCIEKHTTFFRARRSQRTVASLQHSFTGQPGFARSLNRLDTDAIIEAQFGSRRRARTETSFSSCQPAGKTHSPKAWRWLPRLKNISDN